MIRALVTALVLVLPLTSIAAPPAGPVVRVVDLPVRVSGAPFTALAINAAKTTDAIDVKGYTAVTFYLFSDDDNTSVTSMAMSCEQSMDSGSTWHALQSCAVSSGVCTSTDASWSKALSGDKRWPWTVDVGVATHIRCTFTAGGSPAAADKLTVTALGGVQ